MLKWIRVKPPRAVAVVLATLALWGCERRSQPPPAPPVSVVDAPPLPIPAPLPPPTLGRTDLLRAFDTARSAYAAGQPTNEPSLAGRRFSVRESFGCGPAIASQAQQGVAHWTWNPREKSMEISLTPTDLTASVVTPDESERWEAAEGFWIVRPWLRAEGCPAALATAAPPSAVEAAPVLARQTDGLAAVYERQGSRLERRDGKPFSFVIRNAAPTPPAEGYRLVIEGRLSAFANGGAIRCFANQPDERPICIAAAEIDRVAIEAADGKLLKEWRLG